MQPQVNTPALWLPNFPWPQPLGNKYDRGHAIIVGGEWHSTGASKLAAHAALRIGAGLVSVACDARSLPLYATALQAVMTKPVETAQDFSQLIRDPKVKAVLIGPGAGITDQTKHRTLEILHAQKPTVMDADALRVFSPAPTDLFHAIHAPTILTPHAGEFSQLFGHRIAPSDDTLSQARQAASLSGATVIFKGFHTIIAAPDGSVARNTNATPFLATAGSGDVLAGMCTGLLAQGMPAFEAACAAVWLHAEAARRFGAGLIAEDLADQLPAILQEFYPGSALTFA